jgi:hypothetical protein
MVSLIEQAKCVECGRSITHDPEQNSIYCRKGCFTYSLKVPELESLLSEVNKACNKLGM